MTKRPWIVLGGGGHARVVLDLLRILGHDIIGFVDPSEVTSAGISEKRIGTDEAVYERNSREVLLANGLGSVGQTTRRKEVFTRFLCKGYDFGSLVHPFTAVSQSTNLGIGCQIMAGAIIQANCVVGDNVIVNTSASIDHDCVVGSHVHVAPGAVLSGGVVVRENVHIGTGAIVKQGVVLGANSLIAAGALVINDVKPGTVVMGVPATARA